MNIVLIGMPGCGKSTLGVILAKTIGFEFLDTDLVIQKNEGKKLQDIINEEGIEAFIEKEEKAVTGVSCDMTVIATGGSVVLSEKAMKHLKKNGIAVYIKLPVCEIKKRITNITTRGIACAKGETIESVFEQRIPLYEKYADITLDCEGVGTEQAIDRIVSVFRENGSKNGIALP